MTPLSLPAELTLDRASHCAQALAAEAAAGSGELVVDASALQRFDSSALAVLLQLRRSALAAGRGFSVRGLPAHARDLARLYGIDALLPEAA